MTVTTVQVKQYKCHAFIFWQHRVCESMGTVAIDSVDSIIIKVFIKSISKLFLNADTQNNNNKHYKTREYKIVITTSVRTCTYMYV